LSQPGDFAPIQQPENQSTSDGNEVLDTSWIDDAVERSNALRAGVAPSNSAVGSWIDTAFDLGGDWNSWEGFSK